ncbi:hypothetical protein PV10_04214 [Exophiala mesophila]|uniref:Major facilitator superfamily (MFS) profile domain-containing protein n=1 Tax=Exophiala mesophila TaxID=212818 RepID=A0A0D2A1R6_EXOME|nr:uncharacterized protein PV10_04214 [Exophiala mesophila]KIV92963.1 hypothetical protein PV10_04214 [Exophiala mesophila]
MSHGEDRNDSIALEIRRPISRVQTSESISNANANEWLGFDDPGNPYNWSVQRKWVITAIAIFATFTTVLNGTIITVAHEAINEAFNVSDEHFPNSYWPVASWALGGAIFSLVALPLMEDFGVRPGFLVTHLVFICFIIPQALAQNFATLIISRFFTGGCVSILSNTSATVIGNIWDGEKARTIPMSLYITAYVTGSSTGPVIGGVIFQYLNWRWISYLQLIWYGLFTPLYLIFFRETRGSVILSQRAKKTAANTTTTFDQKDLSIHAATDRPTATLFQRVTISVKRPLYMLFTEPVVFVFTLWSAFTVGTVYVFTQSAEQVFVELYGWSASQAGYIQAAVVIGECLGLTGALLSAKLYFASASRNHETPGIPIPEARLYVSVLGSFVGVTGGMFVYAWTSYPSFPWIAPAIGLAMVGFGIDIVVIGIADYVVDSYSKYAGSAVAAVVLGENIFAAFLPLSTMAMYSNLGFQWASTLLGFLALLLSFIPVVIIPFGRRIRARSPFMKEAIIDRQIV